MFPDLLEVVPMFDDPLVASAPVDGVAAAGNNGAVDITGVQLLLILPAMSASVA